MFDNAMLAICFEYIGDEEDYIDNLERLIIFAEQIRFTEKYFGRSALRENQSVADSYSTPNIIAEGDKNQNEENDVDEDSVQKAEEEHENVESRFDDLNGLDDNGTVSNNVGEIPEENKGHQEVKVSKQESSNEENIVLKNNVDELKENVTLSDIAGEIRFNVYLDENGIFEDDKSRINEATTLPTHYSNKCKQCDASFAHSSLLRNHVKQVHEGLFVQCEQCGQKLNRQRDLKQHMKGVHEGVRYPCNICGKNFTQVSSLNTHIRGVHKKIRYKCAECPKETTQLGVLNLHMKDVHNHSGYTCNLCDFKAKTTYDLDRHNDKFHTEITCEHCNLKFETKHQRYCHVSKHHNGINYKKLFKCSKCDFKEISVRELRIHVKAEHEGLPIQKCNFCDFKTSCSDKKLMRAHVAGSHGDQQYLCSLCDFKTGRKTDLNNHMKRKHENIFKKQNYPKIPKLKKEGYQIEFENIKLKDHEIRDTLL